MNGLCSKLKIKTLHSGVFILNFEQVLRIVIVFPLLTLKKEKPVGLLST